MPLADAIDSKNRIIAQLKEEVETYEKEIVKLNNALRYNIDALMRADKAIIGLGDELNALRNPK